MTSPEQPTDREMGEGEMAPALVRPYLPMPRRRAVGRAPVVEPVSVRLLGPRTAVAALLNLLEQVTTLSDVSDPCPTRAGGWVRVYATVTRHHPLTGGQK